MTSGERARAAREGVGASRPTDRGVVEVRGDDRERWLNGMLSNDVAALAPGPERSGCYACRLDRKGRILADVHVLWRDGAYWLETAAAAVGPLVADLERYVIADDVVLADRSAEVERIGLEGPGVPRLLEAAAGLDRALAPEACVDARIAGHDVVVAAFGWSGEASAQLFAPPGSGDAVWASLRDAAAARAVAWVELDPAALEILRVEAGVPRLGAELDGDVFPDEARLGRAISTTKGCYTGQEIVARLRSRGQVNHLLVGLAFDGAGPAAPGDPLEAGGRRTGEVTSTAVSPRVGAIGLGFVRREHAAAGTRVEWPGGTARVTDLPFVAPGSQPAETGR